MSDQRGDAGASIERRVFVWEFSGAIFDERSWQLTVRGADVTLERRPLDVLAYLLRHAGETVTKDELLENLWPGMVTVDAVLSNTVGKLRRALGDEDQTVIVTQHRVGYRLMGPVQRKLIAVQPQSLNLSEGEPVPGRSNFRLRRRLDLSRHSEVWLAEHAKTRDKRVFKFSPDGLRLSALKREATLSRVLNEALGDDPAFIRVVDWNFDSAPYFIECEYGGISWLQWAQAHGDLTSVPLSERLRWMVDLCEAVGRAHSAGVLHKDLKPANCLFEEVEGERRIRLTDFGAGRIDPDRLHAMGITQMGFTQTQAVSAASSTGTPLYMAPEIIAGQSPTTQSDVYSLGVMLYQVVVGDLQRPIAPGWERDIDDALLREDIGAAAQGNIAQRLDSALALAVRLRNLDKRRREHDTEQAALARAVTAEQSLDRARARRPFVWASFAAMGIGLALSLWFYRGAESARQEAAMSLVTTQAINRFLNNELIAQANPSISGRADVTVLEAVDRAAQQIDTSFNDEPETKAAVRQSLASAYRELDQYKKAEAQWRAALAALQTQGVAADHPRLIALDLKLTETILRTSRFDEANSILDRVQDVVERGQYNALLRADLLRVSGQGHQLQGRFDKAVADFSKAKGLMAETLPETDDEMLTVRFNLAASLNQAGQRDEALAAFESLLADQRRLNGNQHFRTLETMAIYAQTLLQVGRLDEAEALYKEAIEGLAAVVGPDKSRTLVAKAEYATLLAKRGHFKQAAEILRDVEKGFVTLKGPQDVYTLITQINLGSALTLAGELDEAVMHLRAAVEGLSKLMGDDSPFTQTARYNLADALLEAGRVEDGAAIFALVPIEALQALEPAARWPARFQWQRGRIAMLRRNFVLGAQELRPAMEQLDTADAVDQWMLQKARQWLTGR